MKREITPEMYNYNKYPGPKFERLVDQVRSEKIALTLVDNYKEAFDLTAFEQRFTSYMLKFDYIVGDWGNEQLRLKGFYKDENTNNNALKISHLEDYLLEYCNYGCAYFVLENADPQEPEIEVEESGTGRNRERGRRRRRRSRQGQNQEKRTDQLSQQEFRGREPRIRPTKERAMDKVADQLTEKVKRSRRRSHNSKQAKRHFDIKTEKSSASKFKETTTIKKEDKIGKRDFVIRQK